MTPRSSLIRPGVYGIPCKQNRNMSQLTNGRPIETMDQGTRSKGKQRAVIDIHPSTLQSTSLVHPAITNALEEALSTPLTPASISSSIDSSFDRRSTIPRPPQAHQPPSLRPFQPRLVSQLTRSTLPTASLTYASARTSGERRSASHTGTPQQGESSTVWKRAEPITLESDPFPDLDPGTGLPIDITRRESNASDAPSLHLQRTITGLLSAPTRSGTTSTSILLSFSLPKVSLPSKPSLDFGRTGPRRSISSSATNEDWASWASTWWGGNKGKVDATLTKEDQADTIEEEQEKHRIKCE